MLTVMHNNRAWHQELMFLEFMGGARGRGTDRGHIGTTLRDPFIDYAMMADAYGMAGEGPITDPPSSARRSSAASRRSSAGSPTSSTSLPNRGRHAQGRGSMMTNRRQAFHRVAARSSCGVATLPRPRRGAQTRR